MFVPPKPETRIAKLASKNVADSLGKFTEYEIEIKDAFPTVTPGQYLCIELENGDRRSYSITNVVNADTVWLLVERVENGRGCDFLDQLEMGGEFKVILPFGRFVLTDEILGRNLPIVMIGTGSGIAPLKPMCEFASKISNSSVELFWGLRYGKEEVWNDVFADLFNNRPSWNYVQCISQPTASNVGFPGRVTKYLQENTINIDAMFFLCGSKSMINEVRSILKDRGVSSSNIFTEQFY